MTKPHIAVVGAGIIGICSAYFLNKSGFNVTLIDKNDPGSMTSHGHACTFADYACVPVNSPDLFREIPSMLLKSDGPLSVDFLHVIKNIGWTFKFLQNCTAKKASKIITMNKNETVISVIGTNIESSSYSSLRLRWISLIYGSSLTQG